MNFNYSEKNAELQKKLFAFMDENIYPNESSYEKEINSGDCRQLHKLVEEPRQKFMIMSEVRRLTHAP